MTSIAKKNISLSSTNFLVAGVLFALALFSRAYGLSDWQITGDEYFTMFNAHERYDSLINPAYYALVVFFYAIAGNEEWIARVPAMLLSTASIPIFFLTWQRLLGRNVQRKSSLFNL